MHMVLQDSSNLEPGVLQLQVHARQREPGVLQDILILGLIKTYNESLPGGITAAPLLTVLIILPSTAKLTKVGCLW
jgi:hypothetical protein